MLLLVLGIALAACTGGEGDAPADAVPVSTAEGERAPVLAGRLGGGEEFRLSNDGDEGPTLLVFYRGAYCGLCRERLRQLVLHLPEYEQRGVRVIAATPDAPAAVARTTQELGAPFPIVSLDTTTLRRWNVLGGERATPVPATFLLDEHGVVRLRHVGRNAGDRISDVALITKLEQLDHQTGER